MNPLEAFTDLSAVSAPDAENEMSRRYLDIVTRWIPVGMRYFNEWPGRPDCGHFFGGVLWYGQDTGSPIVTLALAASSPEFDAKVAGRSADELRQIVKKGLRYLLFTHDTGPEDCVRPKESWGRTEPAGTKWGERGRGFFPESQCGRTITELAVTAALIHDLLGEEEHQMLANIAADYLEHFGQMAPKSGVYNNTQMEENAWTAEGLVGCMMLLSGHERLPEWWEQTKRWMFCTSTMPRDTYDASTFADGKTVRDLCGHLYTTLPDGTAENHGFVHPSYMASSITLGGFTMNALRLFQHPLPPHLFWRRQQCYDLLKGWCDDAGAPHCVQGMDWPYFAYGVQAFFHAIANVYLEDPDAALLERQSLAILERSSIAHGGRMVPEDTVKYCHGQQDPSLMRERMVSSLAAAYLAHRLCGVGQSPSSPEDFEASVRGVRVYPHGGALVHRHARGVTSLSWRNRTMVLPATREGKKLIGPAGGSMLAKVQIKDKAQSTEPVALKIREGADRVSAVLLQDLAEASVRRQLLLASLPNGKCLVVERLLAREALTVESTEQGNLSIINDGYFGDREDLRGARTLWWAGGERVFAGYPTDTEADDVVLGLGDTRWVNVDGRCGLVFEGTGSVEYRNRHHFPVWHAVEDELVLSVQNQPESYGAGETIAELATLWCPEQTHEETAEQELVQHQTPDGLVAVSVDSLLCACNFGEAAAEVPVELALCAGQSLPVSCGVTCTPEHDVAAKLTLGGYESVIVGD